MMGKSMTRTFRKLVSFSKKAENHFHEASKLFYLCYQTHVFTMDGASSAVIEDGSFCVICLSCWFTAHARPSVFPGTERTGTERSGSETPPYSTERTMGQSTARTVALRKGELKLSWGTFFWTHFRLTCRIEWMSVYRSCNRDWRSWYLPLKDPMNSASWACYGPLDLKLAPLIITLQW